MILHSFTVANYRSIKEPLTLSVEAADVKGSSTQLHAGNLIAEPDGNYLSIKAIHGANEVEQSNIFKL